ncbi:YtpI family protein [Halalkalibacter flavus]|uniref:YtpI family protein n=1 Tax=Halalkalibacter flavus TaxID=3090668 RepID=UPI002FCB3EB8
MDKLLTIIIIISAVFFLYNKIRMWRSKESLLKRIYQTKSSLSLGFFLTAFGANLLIYNRSVVDLVVGAIFAILGVANIVYGYRASRHYVAQLGD